MEKKILIAANLILALALAAWFLQSIGWQKVSTDLAHAQLIFLVMGAVFYAGMNLINSFRIAWALRTPWQPKIFFMHMTAMLVSDFTPGRTGYSSLILKLRAAGFNSGKAIKALGLVFASDFLARAVLAILAVAYFAGKVGAGLFILVGVLMLVLGVGLFYLVAFRSQLVGRLLPKIPFFGERLAVAYEHALDSKHSMGFLLFNVAWSLFGAALRGAGWMMAFMALGLGKADAWFATTLVSALVTALSFVPISLAGLGLQEGAGAYFFSVATGISVATAAAVMLLCRVMEFGTDAALGWKEVLTQWTKKSVAVSKPART